MKALVFLALSLVVFTACSEAPAQQSQDELSWTLATQREDGAALPVAQIKSTLIMWGPAGGPYVGGSVEVAAPAVTVNIPRDATPGTRCYVAQTVPVTGANSVSTAQVCKTVSARAKAPSNLTVQ